MMRSQGPVQDPACTPAILISMSVWGMNPASIEALSTFGGAVVTGSAALLALRQYRRQQNDRISAAPRTVAVTGSYGPDPVPVVTIEITNWGTEPIFSVGLIVRAKNFKSPIDPTDPRLLYVKVTNTRRRPFGRECQHLYQLRDHSPIYPGGQVTFQFDGAPTFPVYSGFGAVFSDSRGMDWTCRSGSGYWQGWRASPRFEEVGDGTLRGWGNDPWESRELSPIRMSTGTGWGSTRFLESTDSWDSRNVPGLKLVVLERRKVN